eukprot:848791-Rhodomonas_salina.1
MPLLAPPHGHVATLCTLHARLSTLSLHSPHARRSTPPPASPHRHVPTQAASPPPPPAASAPPPSPLAPVPAGLACCPPAAAARGSRTLLYPTPRAQYHTLHVLIPHSPRGGHVGSSTTHAARGQYRTCKEGRGGETCGGVQVRRVHAPWYNTPPPTCSVPRAPRAQYHVRHVLSTTLATCSVPRSQRGQYHLPQAARGPAVPYARGHSKGSGGYGGKRVGG